MPLIATGEPGEWDRVLEAICFEMRVLGSQQKVEVRISEHCLKQELGGVPDLQAGHAAFDKYRPRIEAAASKIYDRDGVDPEDPFIWVLDADL
jgi:hypothetical protein